MEQIFEDKRTIESLRLHEDGEMIIVGQYGIEKIEPYLERGEMGYVTWFAICAYEGRIIQRINGKYVLKVNYLMQ